MFQLFQQGRHCQSARNIQPPKLDIVEIATVIGAAATVIGLLWNSASAPVNNMTQTGPDSTQFVVEGDYNFYMETDAAEIDPASPTSDRMLTLTAELIEDGHGSDAAALIDRRCALHVDGNLYKASLLHNQGVAEYRAGHLASAQVSFKQAIDTAAFPEAYYGMGLTLFDQGDYPSAIDNYTKAINLDEKPHYLLARAQAYEKNGQPEEAKQDQCAMRQALNALQPQSKCL